MKIKELLSGITIPISNEESDVLDKFSESASVLKNTLTEREQLLANGLVSKDILRRRRNAEGKIEFVKQVRD